MELLVTPDVIISLITLTILEIVLGIDNIIFISILVGRLPEKDQAKARTIGLSLALVLRIVFLFGATWIAQLTTDLITMPALFGVIPSVGFSGRDLIMLAGGLFLLAKATSELHAKLEGNEHSTSSTAKASFGSMIAQIIALDLVFSIDSVITAIGLTQHFWVMAVAVVISVGVMQLSAGGISRFIHRHPTVKVLALAFLIMIGTLLVAEGFEVHVPKGYVYFAMAFSMAVEFLNMRLRGRSSAAPVELRQPPYQG